MKKYAVLDSDNNVINVIAAHSQSTAEEVTASVCVYVTESTGPAEIGLKYIDGEFVVASVISDALEAPRPESTP